MSLHHTGGPAWPSPVTVCINDTWATCETDSGYSPDVLDDLTTQAAPTPPRIEAVGASAFAEGGNR